MSSISKAFEKGKTIQFKKKEIFMSPTKKPKGVYQITDGFIVSYSQSYASKKRIQTILKKGDTFPLVWAVNNERKNVFVEALTDGSAQFLEKEVFLECVTNDHEATQEMVSVLLSILSVYVDRVDNLELDTVREKLISRILFFANRFGTGEGKKVIIDMPITHKLIAESISVSRENITRELKALKNAKIISFRNRQLIVLDMQRLTGEL